VWLCRSPFQDASSVPLRRPAAAARRRLSPTHGLSGRGLFRIQSSSPLLFTAALFFTALNGQLGRIRRGDGGNERGATVSAQSSDHPLCPPVRRSPCDLPLSPPSAFLRLRSS